MTAIGTLVLGMYFYIVTWSWHQNVNNTCPISLIRVNSSRCTCLLNLVRIGLTEMEISILVLGLTWIPRKKPNIPPWSTILGDLQNQEYQLRKKCSNTEFFLGRIFLNIKYGPKNSVFGDFSRSEQFIIPKSIQANAKCYALHAGAITEFYLQCSEACTRILQWLIIPIKEKITCQGAVNAKC